MSRSIIRRDSIIRIRARAVELLTTPAGFNGYSAAELRACKGYARHNNVGVAVCRARDAVEAGLPAKDMISKAEFREIEAAVKKELKASRWGDYDE